MRLLPRPAGPTLSRLLHRTLVRFTKISRVCAGGMKDLAELQESQLTLHQGNTPQHTESSTCPGKAYYVGADGHDYKEHYDADGNKYELRACSRSAYYSDAVGNKYYYGIRKDKQKRVLVLLKLMPCPVKLNTKRYREMREEVTGSAEGKYDVPTKDVLQQWFIATRGNTWSGCKKEFTAHKRMIDAKLYGTTRESRDSHKRGRLAQSLLCLGSQWSDACANYQVS